MTEKKPKFAYLKQVVIGALSGVLVLSLSIVGFGFVGASTTSTTKNSGTTKTDSTKTQITNPATTSGGSCSIATQTADKRLGTFTGQVIDLNTGTVLYDNGGSTGSITASTIKYLTAAAAMKALGSSFKFSTKVVYSPSTPDTITLVGGGDPTLNSLASGDSVYKGAAKLSDLAAQVQTWAQANGVTEVRHLVLDASLFTGSTWETSWPSSERTLGFQPQITALMVDGDRANPRNAVSARSIDPVGHAGRQFKIALGSLAANADITNGVARAGATKIAEVNSAKLSTMIKYMISQSDNTLAEMLARQVALAEGLPANFESIQAAYQKALSSMGLNFNAAAIKDGSGESKNDLITPALFNDLTAKVLAGTADLRSIVSGFPVAGKSGTLVSRFTGANAVARGKVYAKTGSIFHAYSLVGYLDAKDGSRLAFAVFASGPATSVATRTAIDTVVTGIYNCGLDLGNN